MASATKGSAWPTLKSAPPSGGPISDGGASVAAFCAVAAGSCSVATTRGRQATSARLKKTKSEPSTSGDDVELGEGQRPSASATGMLPSAMARPASQRIITRLRSQRSIRAPTGRLKIR